MTEIVYVPNVYVPFPAPIEVVADTIRTQIERIEEHGGPHLHLLYLLLYLSDACAIPYETRQMGAIPPLCDTISKGYCVIWGVSRTGPRSSLLNCACKLFVGSSFLQNIKVCVCNVSLWLKIQFCSEMLMRFSKGSQEYVPRRLDLNVLSRALLSVPVTISASPPRPPKEPLCDRECTCNALSRIHAQWDHLIASP